jgi:hypothetical protein
MTNQHGGMRIADRGMLLFTDIPRSAFPSGVLLINIPRSAFRVPHFPSGFALNQHSAFRIPQSAFPIRFSFVMQAKPAEGILPLIWGR